jgi:hypothetical protein
MAGPALYDDIWMRRGISLLWDAEALTKLCPPKEVISLRQFLQLHAADWPNDRLALVNEKALVVAGLESAIDALTPDEACRWLEGTIYRAIVSFQREVAGGGSQAALILWLTEHRRLDHRSGDDTHYWHCGTEYKGQQIPLSLCLFNGAQNDLRHIHVIDERKTEHWIGLFHPRIS